MDRFIHHHKVIRYNPETRELAIKNWGKYNLNRGGKPVMDCLQAELKEVRDKSLIQYVSNSIEKGDIYRLFEYFQQLEEPSIDIEVPDLKNQALDDTFSQRDTIRGQEEEEEEEKQQQQQSFNPSVENMPVEEDPVGYDSEKEAVKEIIEFWDNNGFGLSNLNAKQQLLAWLEDSRFLKPRQVIIKALNIACANNKRMLSYVTGILKNWENKSLLTVEEIDLYQETQKAVAKPRQVTETISYGRAIPGKFVLDLTAGED
jgi:DnaD/phage-associated family protein